MSDPGGFSIELATAQDVPVILALIRELADYEQLAHEVVATEEHLREALFGTQRVAEALIARSGGEPAGFALFFHNFSTFIGRRGLYLEDLYVRPAWRRRGLGRLLLRELARVARARGCGRMEWAVLDWNRAAIDFYLSLGARAMGEWTVFRLAGPEINRLAEGD